MVTGITLVNLQSNSRKSNQMGNVACHALFVVAYHGDKFFGYFKVCQYLPQYLPVRSVERFLVVDEVSTCIEL